ncbi:MAG: lysophospholipase [Nitrospirota bacterium]
MNNKESILQTADVALSYRSVVPENPRAAILIVHGLSEHKGRYLQLQTELAEAGFSAWAYDQRGFGKSTGNRTDMADYHELLSDLQKMVTRVREESRKLPLILLGHSLGGAVMATYCIDNPKEAEGLILSAPAYEFFPLPKMTHFAGIFMYRLFPKVLIPYPTKKDGLSHDPKIARAFKHDPLVQSSGTSRFYHEFRRMNEHLREQADRITLPTLILQGTADATIVPSGAQSLYDKIKSEKKQLIFYEGFYHEPFNEIGRERVIVDVVSFIEKLLVLRTAI